MGTIAFALPVKAGKMDAGYKFVEQLTGGKSGEHHDSHVVRGLKRVKVYAQHQPAEMVVIYLESDDIGKTIGEHGKPKGEFDKWFGDMLEEITGTRPEFHGGSLPSELLFDWHETQGHAKGKDHGA